MSREFELVLCTRIHRRFVANKEDGAALAQDVERLRHFVESATPLVDEVAVAVDGEDSVLVSAVTVALSSIASSHTVSIIPVSPWGAFIPALNALVLHAAKRCKTSSRPAAVAFASPEVELGGGIGTLHNGNSLDQLIRHLSNDTLVVGAALPGHDFTSGARDLDGCTCPWNTLAVWRADRLALTGFTLVAEGILPNVSGGIEEVTTVALHQRLWPSLSVAKLVGINGIEWDTKNADAGRRAWHAEKMRSKVSRAEGQLSALCVGSNCLFRGVVHHVPLGE